MSLVPDSKQYRDAKQLVKKTNPAKWQHGSFACGKIIGN